MISWHKVIQLRYRKQALLRRVRSTHQRHLEAIMPTASTARFARSAAKINRFSTAC
jgi:hypothetical protein